MEITTRYILHRVNRAYELIERLQSAFKHERCTYDDIEVELCMLYSLIEALRLQLKQQEPIKRLPGPTLADELPGPNLADETPSTTHHQSMSPHSQGSTDPQGAHD